MGDDFEDIRSQMTERQIKLLRHHVKGDPRPYDAGAADEEALLAWGLIEPGEARLHRESTSGHRSENTIDSPPQATDDGRVWLGWYDLELNS